MIVDKMMHDHDGDWILMSAKWDILDFLVSWCLGGLKGNKILILENTETKRGKENKIKGEELMM